MAKYDYWITNEGLLLMEGWARDGLTNEQISYNMGVSRQTLTEWSKKFISISATLKNGKEVVDRKVENALYKRALGYSYTEVKKTETADGTFKTITTKEVVPDVTAQIFWLKNRKVKEWRDKQDIDLAVKEMPQITIKRSE